MHRFPISLTLLLVLLTVLMQSRVQAAEARGKVIAVKGKEATIRLFHIPSGTAPAVSDRVELSYAYGEDVIPVGTWRVSEVTDAATVVATPLEAAQPPQLNLDAVVYVSGTQMAQPESPPIHTGTQLGNSVEEPPQTTADQTTAQDIDDTRRRQLAKDAAAAQMRNREGPLDLDAYARLYNDLLTQTNTTTEPAPKAKPISTGLDLEANHKLAWDYLKGRNGKPRDEARAFELFSRGCDGGLIKNCVTLAWMHYNGKGVEQDLNQAVIYYRYGCEGGYYEACTDSGNMYREGKGIAQDVKQAMVYYDIGCRNGVGKSCDWLGKMAVDGQGLEKDYGQAFKFFEQGCEAGYATSCGNMGVMYYFGWGVEKNREKAVPLFRQGCNGNDDVHCGYLGVSYSRGWGVQKNLNKAIPLLEKGCATGIDRFCNRLEEIR